MIPCEYDFVDLGSSTGASIRFAMQYLGGQRGLGIDRDPAKVRLAQEQGLHCVLGDATQIPLPDQSVRFVVMNHFLEHLQNLDTVSKTLRRTSEVASDFLFIQGPYFDGDVYLRSIGLKFYWSDWHGHRCHLLTSDLTDALTALGLKDFFIFGKHRVVDSGDPSIHPTNSPRDQHLFDSSIHPSKTTLLFTRPLYREIIALVRLRRFRDWPDIVRRFSEWDLLSGVLQETPGNLQGQTERSSIPRSDSAAARTRLKGP